MENAKFKCNGYKFNTGFEYEIYTEKIQNGKCKVKVQLVLT